MITTDTIAERIEAERRERVSRLARQGQHLHVTRDTITAGWIVHNPRIPGCCEIVNERGECTCQHYRLWDRCKHSALVAVRIGQGC